MKRYYVYMMANRVRTLYIGVTSNLQQRVLQHKQELIRGFTRKYDITRLVWFEEFDSADQALAAEKKLKGRVRSKKVALIEAANPQWNDLAEGLNATRGKQEVLAPALPNSTRGLCTIEGDAMQIGAKGSSVVPDPSLRSG